MRSAEFDALVNNAGIHYDTWQGALDADWRIVREAFETNLFGAWRMAQAFAPAMREAGWGRIVNVSSAAGSLASMGAGTPAHATSKAALNALTRVLAGELQGNGVLVNAVCPGWVATRHGRRRRSAGRAWRRERNVGRRFARQRPDWRLLSRRPACRVVARAAAKTVITLRGCRSAGTRAASFRCRAGAGGRSSAPDRRTILSTGRSSRRFARPRTAR